MKYALDTESNQFIGDVISLALVPFHGEHKPLYIVIDYAEETISPWVAENVIPHLGAQPRVSRETAGRMIAAYLRLDSTPEVIADWPEDLSHLLKLLIIGPGKMVNTPAVTLRYEPCQGFNASDHSKVPHNALEDAIALKDYCLDHGI